MARWGTRRRRHHTRKQRGERLLLVCRAPAAARSFIVPASILEALPASSGLRFVGTISVSTTTGGTVANPSGLDFFTNAGVQYILEENVNYK